MKTAVGKPLVYAIVLLLAVVLILSVLLARQSRQLARLRDDISCLRHPHGESSVYAVRGRDGRFRVSKPHRTGC